MCKEYIITLVGNSGVGKSALKRRVREKAFDEDYDYEFWDDSYKYMYQTHVDGEQCILNVRVVRNDYSCTIRMPNEIQFCDGLLLVYSVTDTKSFDSIMHWHSQILSIKQNKERDCSFSSSNCPMILIATKIDLVQLRKVTEEQGRELGRKLNIPFVETSSLKGTAVDDCFHQMVRMINSHDADQNNSAKSSTKRRCTIA